VVLWAGHVVLAQTGLYRCPRCRGKLNYRWWCERCRKYRLPARWPGGPQRDLLRGAERSLV